MKTVLMNFGDNILSRQQMKNVFGGRRADATAECRYGPPITCSGANCPSDDANATSDGQCQCDGREKFCMIAYQP